MLAVLSVDTRFFLLWLLPADRLLAAQQQQASADTSAAAAAAPLQTLWFQKKITLPQHKRGCHVITRKILAELPELSEYEIGLANLFSKLPCAFHLFECAGEQLYGSMKGGAWLTEFSQVLPTIQLRPNKKGAARQKPPSTTSHHDCL